MPFGVRVQTDFFLGGQGHAAQGKAGAGCPQAGQRVLGGGLGRVAGGEVEQLFAVPFPHGLQGRKDGAHGLADACGSLTEQPRAAFMAGVLSGAAGTVNFSGHGPLPGAVLRKGKLQGRKVCRAPGLPVPLPLCPGRILLQQVVQELLQFFLGKAASEAPDLVGVDLIIGQPDIRAGQILLGGI